MRCLFAARQGLPPGFLTALHYAFPFHLGACLKERTEEGKDPPHTHTHTLVNNKPLCSYSLMRPLAPQSLEQRGLVATSYTPPTSQPASHTQELGTSHDWTTPHPTPRGCGTHCGPQG